MKARLPLACGLVLVSVLSCTLTGLTDYELQECIPASVGESAADDVCSRLTGGGVDDCHAYRCDAASRRCALAVRDDDRDGQPSVACGGEDCDDEAAEVGGGFAETCSDHGPYVDNDCDGVIDEGLGFTLRQALPVVSARDVRVDVLSGEALASYVQKRASGECIQLVGEQGAIASGCAFGASDDDRSFLPRQPHVTPVGKTGYGVAYVETGNGCPVGALGYRVFDGAGAVGATRMACGAGAALPSLSVAPGGRTATLAYLETSISNRDDALDDCAQVVPAAVRLTQVKLADGSAAALSEPWPMAVTSSSRSLHAPSLLRVGSHLLLGAPADDGAKVWLLDEMAGPSGDGVVVPGFTDARSVALAMAGDAGRLAAVAQLGCGPQSVGLALGDYDDSLGTLVFTSHRLLVDARALTAAPKIVWLSRRGEWLVTWLEVGPRIAALRVAPDGSSVGQPFVIVEGAEVAAANDDAALLGFASARGDESFVRGDVGCVAAD